MENMAFDCDALECKDALRSSDSDYDGARKALLWQNAHRQDMFVPYPVFLPIHCLNYRFHVRRIKAAHNSG